MQNVSLSNLLHFRKILIKPLNIANNDVVKVSIESENIDFDWSEMEVTVES